MIDSGGHTDFDAIARRRAELASWRGKLIEKWRTMVARWEGIALV
jgi:hypothetical protein